MSAQSYKLSCTSCRNRKIKCQRVHPCANCSKAGHTCVFPQPVRQPKARNVEITSRLSRLEKLVSSLGHDPASLEKHLATTTSSDSNAGSSDAVIEQGIQGLQLKEYEPISKADGSRYLSSDFWSSLSGEVDGLRQLLNEASDDEEEYESRSSRSLTGEENSPGPQLFYDPAQKVDLLSLHPPTAHMTALCNLYFTRVDPLFKVLHRPSTLSFAYAAMRDKRSISKGQEALLFAIYLAAVTSLSDSECLQNFGQPKAVSIKQYRSGIEAALANANFLDTTEIVVLQALLIYLMSMSRHPDDRKSWTLFALACRVGQSLELFDEGSMVKLSRFEVEMRRRLFWQILVLDGFYVESRGTPPLLSGNMYDTQQPLNLSDEQLSPMSGVIGEAQTGATEMTFSLLSQTASVTISEYTLMNPRNRSISEETETLIEQREQLMQRRCREMHTKFVDCYDPSVPMLWSVAETGRIIILRLWLLVQRPMFTLRKQTLHPAKREYVLAGAVSMLELVSEIENHPTTAPWTWYSRGYVPWYAIAIILAELCVQTRGMLADRAWNVIHKTYDLWGNRVAASKTSGFWRPMKRMLEKAKGARLGRTSSSSPSEPDSQVMLDWSRITAPPGESSIQEGDFKQLHYASVAVALGQPEELEQFLTRQKQSSEIGNDQSMFPEELGGAVNWDDWDTFIQTTIEAEGKNPSLGQETFLTGGFNFQNAAMPDYTAQADKPFSPTSGMNFSF